MDDANNATTTARDDATIPKECAMGLHSWVGENGLLPADTECTDCGEQYGHPD